MADGDDMYSALDIAKYIISKCNRENCPISNLQLQKILYNLQKAFLQRDLTLSAPDCGYQILQLPLFRGRMHG